MLLALVGYFVIYPYIMKTYFSDPMNVYETTIKEAFKGINNTTNTIIHNKGIYSLEASFDSNIEDLKEFGGYTYGINFGIDPTKKNIQQGLYIKNNSTNVEHSYYSYLKDNKYYDKYSSYRDYIYLGEANSEDIDNFFSSIDIDKLFDFSNNLNNDEITYISDKIATLIIESINKDRLTQEDASISINGESLKVTNNKYEIDYDIAKNMFEHIRNGLKDDEKAIQIISKLTEESTSDIKKTIESMKFPEKSESNSNVVNINIYTYGNKNEIIGFSINDKDENINIYYYNKNGVAEGKITSNYKNTNQQNEMVVIKLTSIKESNGTKITLFYDDEDITDSNKGTELLTLNIKSWDEKGFNIDYKINIEDENFNGNLKFSQDISNEKVKFSLDFSLESGNEFIKVTTSLNEDWTSEIANINTSTAQQLGEEEISIYKNEFMNALKETPIGKALTTVSNDYDNTIGDYYTNNYPNNSTSSNEQIVSGSEEKDNI